MVPRSAGQSCSVDVTPTLDPAKRHSSTRGLQAWCIAKSCDDVVVWNLSNAATAVVLVVAVAVAAVAALAGAVLAVAVAVAPPAG